MIDIAISNDAFNMLCGKKLGEGIHRTVYACRLRDDLVVKVEHEPDHRYFANVREDMFYSEYQDNPKIAKWLAPVRFLSPDARILLQDRCEPITEADMPKMLPAFLTDIKADNFGRLKGNIVCMDYALNNQSVSARLRKW